MFILIRILKGGTSSGCFLLSDKFDRCKRDSKIIGDNENVGGVETGRAASLMNPLSWHFNICDAIKDKQNWTMAY